MGVGLAGARKHPGAGSNMGDPKRQEWALAL